MTALLRPPAPGKTKAAAHRLVAETAHAMALELFEGLARDDLWYKLYSGQHPNICKAALPKFFARSEWHHLVPQARAALAELLARPGLSPADAARIHEALVLDNSLPQGQNAASVPSPMSPQ